ncbi:MAG: PhoH family protein [Treponema sp.]|jgi:phosphate starvation-inducible PhoH-like protein|nr:PhoH family protein [Treponema sp.]
MDDGITIVLDSTDMLSGVCGANDGNLKVMEGSLGGRIAARGNEIRFEGADEAGIRHFKTMMDTLVAAVREGESPSTEYVEALAGTLVSGETEGAQLQPDAPLSGENALSGESDPFRDAMIQIPQGFHRVYPRGKNQAAYIQGMRSCDIAFCVGPAGTGKTYLAIAEALRLVLSKKVRKLVLTRPVVEAGENLGFLPGDLTQKINPYLRPLYDAMESLIPYDIIHRMEETRAIEIAPLAYMRGRSLNDCAVILDEAQNTTKEQMKMFLTRIGREARAVITGDATQIDLPRRTDSGLLHAVEILKNIEGIHFSFLHTADVVRNPLIKKIIQAYNEKEG